MAFHLRGVVVPDGEERDLYVVGDRITFEPLAHAETVVAGGWLLPGLVDVHTHPGAEHNGWTAVLSGLEEGQSIVLSGQFLIDSEASLHSAIDRLSSPAGDGTAKESPGHDHNQQNQP